MRNHARFVVCLQRTGAAWAALLALSAGSAASAEEPVSAGQFPMWWFPDVGALPNPYRRKLVPELSRESVNRSVEKLDAMEPYFMPGPLSPGVVQVPAEPPLPADLGTGDVDAILSNRRFLKVYVDLRSLPPRDAAKLVSAEIEKTLPAYRERYETELTGLRKAYAKTPGYEKRPHVIGIAIQTSDNPDGRPTMNGLRYKVLALVWCAGSLGLKDTNAAVREVVAYALEQRRVAYVGDDTLPLMERMAILWQASLYNRQVLTPAVLNAVLTKAQSREVQSAVGVQWKTWNILPYDTPLTRYETHMVGGPLDTPLADPVTTATTVTGLSDADFDRIVAAEGPVVGRP